MLQIIFFQSLGGHQFECHTWRLMYTQGRKHGMEYLCRFCIYYMVCRMITDLVYRTSIERYVAQKACRSYAERSKQLLLG